MKIPASNRLHYRLISLDDADLLFELDQDPEVMKYINGGTPTSMDDVHKRFLPRLSKYRNPEKGWGLWQVTVSETNEYIGWILVRPMDFFSPNPQWHNLELGWRFKRSSWGKGYASEAAQAVANEVVKQPEVTAICAIADEDNAGSINIMKKLGMQFVKSFVYEDHDLGVADQVVHYENIIDI